MTTNQKEITFSSSEEKIGNLELENSEAEEPFISERALGNGTLESPFLVSNAQELKQAINTSFVNDQTLHYIKFLNDIIYKDSDTRFTISKNTVLDGDGHALLYNGTNYGTAHFQTGANNLNITYKNLQFGNASYPNSNYYGILYNAYNNIAFTVEDISYNIQNGSQPFYGNNNAGNSITFKGNNTFTSMGSSYGGEFIEGIPTVNFATGSNTTIYNDSSGVYALFWSTNQVINVEQGACVSIEASKAYLFWTGGTINMKENAQFLYTSTKGIYNTTSQNTAALSNSGSVIINVSQDAIGHFRTSVNAFSGINPVINVTSPDYMLFDHSDQSKTVLGTMTLTINRKDNDQYNYSTNYLLGTSQTEVANNLLPNKSEVISTSTIKNGSSTMYGRCPTIIVFTVLSNVGSNVSSLITQVSQWSPQQDEKLEIQFKLSKDALYKGDDSTSQSAQQSIENQTGLKNQVINSEIGKFEFTDLSPVTYYAYAKIDDYHIPGYQLYSPWIEEVTEIAPYIELSFSAQGMAFSSPISGIFKSEENSRIINSGNIPMSIDLTELKETPSSSPEMKLVPEFISRNQELILTLVGKNEGTNQIVRWGPLEKSVTPKSAPLIIEPYWGNNEAILYFEGNYSGPLIGPMDVQYNLSFNKKGLT